MALNRWRRRFEGNERVDLPDFRAAFDRIYEDFKLFVKQYLDDEAAPRVVKRYQEGVHSTNTFKLLKDVNRALQGFDQEWLYVNTDSIGTTEDIPVLNNTTNYVEVRIKFLNDDLQTRAFWDTDIGLTGQEFFDEINVRTRIDEEFEVNQSGFTGGDLIPLFEVDVDGAGNITEVRRADDFFWKGRSFSLPANDARVDVYESAVKDLRSYVDFLNAIVGELKSGSGSIEDAPWSSIKLLREYQNLFFARGGEILWEGSNGKDILSWSDDIVVAIGGRQTEFILPADTATLKEEECLYLDIPETVTPGVDEQQQLALSAPAVAGDITLNHDGNITAPIAFDASEKEIADALNALASLKGGVQVTGTFDSAGPVVIDFSGPDGEQPQVQITVDTNNLGITVTPTTNTEGVAAVGTTLTKVVGPLRDVPINPTAVGHSAKIMVLFYRRGGKVYGAMDIPDLSSGETATIGLDLPKNIRTKLGILSETSFEAYSAAALAAGIISANDSLPAAISKLATRSTIVLADYIDLHSTTLPDVGGLSTTIDGNAGVNGDQVLFADAALDGIYELSGVGSSIVWTKQTAFDGAQEPAPGAEVSVLKGTEYFKTVWRFEDASNRWKPMDTSVLENEPTGFPTRDDSEISFDAGTRTFTIQPKSPSTHFDYATKGRIYRKTAPVNVVIDDIEGPWFIYFDGPTLVASQTFQYEILKKWAFVSEIYWDATNQEAVLLTDERHGLTLDGATHRYLHNAFGTRWISGLAAGNFNDAGDGSADAHAQASFSDGLVFDEDIAIEPQNASEVLAASNTGALGASDGLNSSTTQYSQSFTASQSGPLSSLAMYLQKANVPTGNLVFDLRADDGGGLPGALLATSSPLDVSTLTGIGTLITLAATGASLVAGTRYHIVANVTGVTFGPGDSVVVRRIDGYAGEQASLSFNSGSTWSPNASSDYGFEAKVLEGGEFKQVLDPIANLPILYREGASGNWRKITASEYLVATAVSGRAYWNENTGVTWQLTEATDGYIVGMWAFATNDINHPVVLFMGQREDVDLSAAQANQLYQSLTFGTLPSLELKVLYRFLFETNDTFTNAVKTALREAQDLRAAIDSSLPAATPNDHGSLSGLNDPDHGPQAVTTTGVVKDGGLSASDIDVKESLDTVNKLLGQLRLKPVSGSPKRLKLTGANRVLNNGQTIAQEIRNLLVSFNEIQIDFETGEIFESDGITPFNGGANDFTPFAIGAGEFFFYSLTLLPNVVGANNTISLTPLLLSASASNATLANAPRAAFAGSGIKIGQVVVQEDSGGILDLGFSNIYQLGTGSGSGGSGTGDANSFIEDIKARLRCKTLGLGWATPAVFEQIAEALTDTVNTTATYDVANNIYNFTAPGEIFRTIQLFGSRFLASDVTAKKLELHGLWENFDPLAVWEVSQNGGDDWQTLTMNRIGESNKVVGQALFPDEPATLENVHEYGLGALSTVELNDSTRQSYAIPLQNISKERLFDLTLQMNKTGAPSGFFSVKLYADDGGAPGDLIGSSGNVDIAALSTGNIQPTVALQKILAPTARFWAVIETDAAYKASFSTGVDFIGIRVDTATLTYSEGNGLAFNGTVWADDGNQINFNYEGFFYDLRVRVTSGTADVDLKALAVLFGDKTYPIIVPANDEQVIRVNGDDDQFEFTITKFQPSTRMRVYDVATGMVYRYGVFTLSGQTVIFAPGQFLQPGQTFDLIFSNSVGSGFDNSDENALLMAENRMGSLDPSLDRSIAGEGGLTRADNGKLIEHSLREISPGSGTYEWVFAEVD